jgi:BolA protein
MTREARIKEKLTSTFAPERLLLENESDKHKGPPGRETHWNAIIVSNAFAGRTPVARQRAVYAALDDEMKGGMHALTMKTLTPDEWERAGGMVTNPAPKCRGGEHA